MLLGSPDHQEQMADYLNRPILPDRLSLYFDAFLDINHDRIDGGAIPFGAIDRCATRLGVAEGEDFERFKTLIKHLDREIQVWIEAERKMAK